MKQIVSDPSILSVLNDLRHPDDKERDAVTSYSQNDGQVNALDALITKVNDYIENCGTGCQAALMMAIIVIMAAAPPPDEARPRGRR